MDLQKQLDLFHAKPPRLFPHQPEQRAIIDRMLAQLAATDVNLYEERLEVYNARCDEYGVQRFPRVIVTREEIPAPPVEETTEEIPAPEEGAVIVEEGLPVETIETVPEEIIPAEKPKSKKSKKSKKSSPTKNA